MIRRLRQLTIGQCTMRVFVLPCILAASGCATVPKDAGFGDVQGKVAPHLAERVYWQRNSAEDEAVKVEVAALLSAPLTLSGATQIALLNNPELQSLYEGLGIAQADLVQAGLLENPVFAASVRMPDHDRSGSESRTVTRESGGGFSVSRSTESATIRNNIEFALVQNFLDLLMIPMRKKMAEAHFEETKLAISHEILVFAGDVKRHYYDYVWATQQADLLHTVTTATGAASEFAIRQYEAGNLSRLEMSRENAFHGQALLEASEADLEVRLARERLSRTLGLWNGAAKWELAMERLATPPPGKYSIGELESHAIANRLDLAAKVKELEILAFGVKTTRRWRWLGLLDLSVSTERDGDGVYVTGPALELQLPLFDQGQAKLAVAESNLRAGAQHVSSRAIDIRSETRQAWERLSTSQDTVAYFERVLLPTQQAILDESQLHYNAMLIGVYHLLLDKQQQIDTARRYVDALHEYWIARTELEMAVGGSLPTIADRASEPGSMPEMETPAILEAVPSAQASTPASHENH